jgi:hypothetical protein
MTTPLSPLRAALERGLAPGGDLAGCLEALGDYAVTTVDDAHALADAVARLPGPACTAAAPAPDGSLPRTGLYRVIGLFQSVDSRAAFDVLRAEGVPRLLAAFDARFSAPPGAEGNVEELLFLLKVVGMYQVEEVVDRIIAAARRPLGPSSYLWSVIFSVFDENHPQRVRLFQALRDPLPGGFLGVAYLDFANALLRTGHPSSHPFDTPDGRGRLRSFLTDPDEPARAHSAAGALAFIARPERDELLALAMDHPCGDVQLEAARAAAQLGSESALKFLVRACLELRWARVAAAHLKELGHGGRIPAEALSPDFQALAEMVEWLSHPREFGRAPDAVEIDDTRELVWPPTHDRRRLWLVRYRYEPDAPGGQAREGVGIVGSLTFALFQEPTAELAPDDLYALYCCWELQVRGVAGAPARRSIAAGRAILDRAQSEEP